MISSFPKVNKITYFAKPFLTFCFVFAFLICSPFIIQGEVSAAEEAADTTAPSSGSLEETTVNYNHELDDHLSRFNDGISDTFFEQFQIILDMFSSFEDDIDRIGDEFSSFFETIFFGLPPIFFMFCFIFLFLGIINLFWGGAK